MENNYIPSVGDVILTKSGNRRLIMQITDAIEQDITDSIMTMEPILVVAPVTTDAPFYGVLVPKEKWTGGFLISVDVFNREYIFESEIDIESGYVYSDQTMKQITDAIVVEHLNCKLPTNAKRAVNICKSCYTKNKFQQTLHEENPSSDKIH